MKPYFVNGKFKALFLILVLALNGCGEHNKIKRDIESYRERLENYTNIAISPTTDAYVLDAPIKKDLKIEFQQLHINLREFYAFNNCSLNQLVAERNTALGKVQLPSIRFAYESKLLSALLACKHNIVDNADDAILISKLEQWSEVKKHQFPLVWANLLTQSTETYTHLAHSKGFISGTSSDNFQATKQALVFLLQSKDVGAVDTYALEQHLKELGNTPLLARQWRTQLLLTMELNKISSLLSRYLNKNTCSTLQQRESIEIMQNIFRIFFAERLQPVAAQLNKYHYHLSGLIDQLIASPELPKQFVDYLALHNTENYEAYTVAMKSHITLWQKVFTLCN